MGNISRLFLSSLQKQLSRLDIERSFYPLLLIEAGKGKIIQQELARLLSCDKVQIVRIIDYLSASGYVEKTQDPKDRRKSYLRITPKAETILPDVKKAIKKSTDIATKNMTEEQVNQLFSLIKKIETNLESNK